MCTYKRNCPRGSGPAHVELNAMPKIPLVLSNSRENSEYFDLYVTRKERTCIQFRWNFKYLPLKLKSYRVVCTLNFRGLPRVHVPARSSANKHSEIIGRPSKHSQEAGGIESRRKFLHTDIVVLGTLVGAEPLPAPRDCSLFGILEAVLQGRSRENTFDTLFDLAGGSGGAVGGCIAGSRSPRGVDMVVAHNHE